MPTSPPPASHGAQTPSSYDVLLEAVTLMEDKIMRAIGGLSQRLDALESSRGGFPTTTAFPSSGTEAKANGVTRKRSAAHDIAGARKTKQLRDVPARTYTEPVSTGSQPTSSSKKTTSSSDENDGDDDILVVSEPDNTKPTTVTPTPSGKEVFPSSQTISAPKPSSTSSKGKKKQTATATSKSKSSSGKDKVDLDKVLTHDEQHLIETGRGRRGEAIETPLGWCYFTRNNETARDVGKHIGVEPLVIVSLNRWTLKLKVHDHLVEGTRLWIQPQEAWEFEYIAEDRTKVLKQLYRRIHEVFPDFVKSSEPLKSMKEANLANYSSSGKFYDEILQTLAAAELQARSEKDDEKFTDVQTIRERFGEKWIEVGFLPPSAIINRAMNKAC